MNRLSPADIARLSRPAGQALERAAVAAILARAKQTTPEAILKVHYGGDEAAARIINKAAVNPASTTQSGWADTLFGSGPVADFLTSLPASAAAGIMSRALQVSLEGYGTIALPSRGAPDADNLAWVDEANPIPVRQLTFSNATVGPVSKLAAIVVLTRETAELTAAPEIIRTALREDAAASLDASLFSATAASSARPAGLMAGVSPLAETAGGGFAALEADLRALVAAVTANGAGQVTFVMHPETAPVLQLLGPNITLDVLTSTAVPAGTVIALEAAALAFAFGPTPRFSVSTEAAIHMESETPTAIGTAGTPNVVSAPTRSAFQTDCWVIRAILPMAWAWRGTGRIAWIEDATWSA